MNPIASTSRNIIATVTLAGVQKMGKKARNKGKRGEREWLKCVESLLSDRGVDVELHRNHQQTEVGGADCIDLPGVAIEVKRQENLQIAGWWRQALRQAERCDAIAVLAYKQNRKPWTVIIPEELSQMGVQKTFRSTTELPPGRVLTAEQFADFYVGEVWTAQRS